MMLVRAIATKSRGPRTRGGRTRESRAIQEPVVKVQRVARMGIDAQRSGASELPDRAVEVRRAQGATTKAIPVWIVEEEQRSDRPQDPCALRVAAARGHLRCWRPSTMHTDIACGPPPSIWPPGPRHAARRTFPPAPPPIGNDSRPGPP